MKTAGQRDVADIIDRHSIAELKAQRIGTEENKREFEAFEQEIETIKLKYPEFSWEQILKLMSSINNSIWVLEASLKSNKDILPNPHNINDPINKEVLSQIGKDTIMIRNINNLRVNFKNLINSLVKEGFVDTKSDHLSE